MPAREIRAVGNHVVLELISVERELFRKRGQIYVPSEDAEETFRPIVYNIGKDVEDPDFKVGDEVTFNPYDMKGVSGEEGRKFVVTRDISIMAVVKSTVPEEKLTTIS